MPKPAPYPMTDHAETEAILLFKCAINGHRIKLEVKERDKVPNIDGYLEVVDDEGVPTAKLDVQVRAISTGNKYRCPVSLVEYSGISTSPLLLIAVDRQRKTVYWKHIHPGMSEYRGKEEQQTFTVKFDVAREVVDSTETYIAEWLGVARSYQTKLFEPRGIEVSADPQTSSSVTPARLVPTEIQAEALRSSFVAASNGLLNWPKTIAGDKWLERPLLEEIRAKIPKTVTSTTILLGEPGSGKSALLSKLAELTIADGRTVLALKADHLPVEVASLDALSQFLGLVDCVGQIEQMAGLGPVLILIDQLDALADLADLKSGRLNAVIQFMSHLSGKHNVHVVASCRSFEAEHDPRLRSMQPEPERQKLELPPWAVIEPIFSERGLASAGWPEAMKQLLRTPQHLMIFLEIVPSESKEQQIFKSYLSLLHRYWDQQFDRLDSACEDVLLDLAFKMSEREELWLPSAQFNRAAIRKLAASGFLTADQDRGRVGFRHQTMFEYARARAFVRTEESLVQHVLERQDGVFVRPLLWTILPYLREASRSVYRRDLAALWRQDLRFHLRVLLIEFLGLLEDPDEFEAGLLAEYIARTDYQATILMSIAKSAGWFARTSQQYLPSFMNEAEEVPGLNFLLQQAIIFARDEVLSMITNIWLPNPKKDYQTIAVLRNLDDWNEAAVKVGEIILERTDVAPIWVCTVASSAQKTVPHIAARLIKAAVGRQIMVARKEQQSRIEALPPLDPTDEKQRLAREVELRWNTPVKKVLDSNDWDCAFDLATSNPDSFVQELFPLIIDAVEEVAYEVHDVVAKYRGDSLAANFRCSVNDEEEGPDDNSILGALRLAVELLAEKDTKRFLELLDEYKSSTLLCVHGFLIGGLLKLGSKAAPTALQYLIEDDRRFFVGYNTDEQSLTEDLIGAIAPNLSHSDCKRLEDAIRGADYYCAEAIKSETDAAEGRLETQRCKRLKLLRAFPHEYLSQEARLFIESEERLLGIASPPVTRPRTTLVKSVMSAGEMEAAGTEDLEKLLTEVNDSCPESHPDDWTKGGVFETGREFGELAAKDPRKAMTVVSALDPRNSTVAAGKAIEGMSRSEIDSEELFGFIQELEQKGFCGTEYRASVAKALTSRIAENAPLSEDMLLLLEKFLGEVPKCSEESKNRRSIRTSSPRDARKESVLWGRDAEPVPISESYAIVYALTLALLQPKPQQPARWLAILTNHLHHGDSIDIWCSMSVTYLKFVSLCDHEQAEIFLNELFEAYPSLFQDHHATRLIAETTGCTSEDFASRWIPWVSTASWPKSAQAYGELLCFQHLRFPSRSWPRETLESLIGSEKTESDVLVGMAYVASKLWHYSQYRQRASEVIDQLLALDRSDIVAAVSTYISNGVCYAVDQHTERILSQLSEQTAFLSGHSLFNVAESLVEITEYKPDFVYGMCMKILSSAGANIGDIRTSECVLSGPLLDIAIRLQRMDGHHRQQGMDVFEGLLRCRAHEAIGMLHTLDGRPKSDNALTMPRRRTRRKPKPS